MDARFEAWQRFRERRDELVREKRWLSPDVGELVVDEWRDAVKSCGPKPAPEETNPAIAARLDPDFGAWLAVEKALVSMIRREIPMDLSGTGRQRARDRARCHRARGQVATALRLIVSGRPAPLRDKRMWVSLWEEEVERQK